jgi:arylsulfatase A-like enzyme
MTRRSLLRLAAGTATAAAIHAQTRPASRARQPNFVFIMADDLAVHDLGCYGQKLIRTPNIDRLAEQGMRFTDCYAGSTVCAPSRSVLMTGRHAGHTTVRWNASVRTGARVSLRADDPTVASVLKGPEWRDAYDENRAYATGMFGKWGLGEPGTEGLPNDKGWDEWFGFLNQQHAHEHYPAYLWRNRERETLYGNVNAGKREYASDLFCREALHFIDRHRYRPFLLYFTPTVPHARYEAPDQGAYGGQPWPEQARSYAAMVTRMDGYVGRIMAKLKEAGLDQNTVVFFTSDNGGTFEFQPFNEPSPLRGKKGSLYDGGIRVPMIVRWTGRVKPGSVSDLPWSFSDVLPTMSDLAGVRGIPPLVDGMSIAPTLAGERQRPERPLYWEAFGSGGFQQAVRAGRWKAVRFGLDKPLELYDLTRDPGEKNNIAAQHPQVTGAIDKYLRECRTDAEDYPTRRTRRTSQPIV